ncbi:MAG TPA: nicotinate phosphoribosyltransferase [Spirochaetota bacterium]|nr:nicotinate phosphoribosyltransferase [Spirochaetota bacterium]
MIIKSLLDQDFYKFTMGQVVLHQFPDFWVRYAFKCRTPSVEWTPEMVREIEREIGEFCTLGFTVEELEFLRSIRFLKKYFIDFLSLYRPSTRHVRVKYDGDLSIEVEGPWFLTIFFEVPVLAIVNEVYFRHTADFGRIESEGKKKLDGKIRIAETEGFRFSEFGTRRRFSFEWQSYVIDQLHNRLPAKIYTGTSNVYFAKRCGKTPIGTMAHEFIQAGQAVNEVTLAHSQRYMLQKWVDEYRGDLGIALSDTLGLEKFLIDFDLYFAKLYDGVRHDSGDPVEWAERMITHYESLRIDPRTKSFVFSDALDFETATMLWRTFSGRTNVAFGIGTNLTNDFPGVQPLNIVMKLAECNGKPVAKISDNPGKTMCDNDGFLSYLRDVIKK